MRIVGIGAVAAGTSAAAKARRNDEDAQIVLYEKDSYISYSGCGMPYYLGGQVNELDALTPRDPAFFKSKYNVDVLTQREVLSINPGQKTLRVKNLVTGEEFDDYYDKLVIATGASAVMPPIGGINQKHVFTLRSIGDMLAIKGYIDENKPQAAVIIGTGFIGLEVCENLHALGISVTLIEKLPQVTPGLDDDMAVYVQEHLQKHGVQVFTSATVTKITPDSVCLSGGGMVPSQLVLVAAGVRPNTRLASEAGISLGTSGAIRVNEKMETSIPGIYACGDCIEHMHLVTDKPVYRPLGSTANKTGRIAGDQMTGGDLTFKGILGTGIFKVFDLTVAQTGLSLREAESLGMDIVVCHNIKPNKPEYLGGKEMVIKAIAGKKDGRLLGVQIAGYEGVDKRLDVFVTAISLHAKAEDLFHLDLGYAPPFSTTKDPVMYTGMILENARRSGRPLITAKDLDAFMASGQPYQVIDARVAAQYDKGHIAGAQHMPHANIRTSLEKLDRDVVTVTYCNKGVTGNAAQNILLGRGFKRVFNLSGGYKQFQKTIKKG